MREVNKTVGFGNLLSITENAELKKFIASKMSREYSEAEKNKLLGLDEDGCPVISLAEVKKINEEKQLELALNKHGNDPQVRMDLGGFPRRRNYRSKFMSHDYESEYPSAFKALNKGHWLYLYGTVGTWKTSLACHLGWKYLMKYPVREVSFLSIKDWMVDLMPNEDGTTSAVEMSGLKPFVILDDIDKFQINKDFQILSLFRLIDHLYRNADNYHVVITGNKSISALYKLNYSDRFSASVDRIREMSVVVNLKGGSKREGPSEI